MNDERIIQFNIPGLYEVNPDSDRERLFGMMKEAFREYPKLMKAYPDYDDRQAAIGAVIYYYGTYDLRFGKFYSLDRDINEAIGILHSDYLAYEEDMCLDADCCNEDLKASLGRLTPEQEQFWWDFFDEFDRQEAALDLPDPCIYVDYVAVAPDRQGQGRGSEIMRHLQDYAASMGLPIMLFTNGERDIRFYRRLGFEIVGVTKSEEFRFENTYMVWRPNEGR